MASRRPSGGQTRNDPSKQNKHVQGRGEEQKELRRAFRGTQRQRGAFSWTTRRPGRVPGYRASGTVITNVYSAIQLVMNMMNLRRKWHTLSSFCKGRTRNIFSKRQPKMRHRGVS